MKNILLIINSYIFSSELRHPNLSSALTYDYEFYEVFGFTNNVYLNYYFDFMKSIYINKFIKKKLL